MLAIDSEVSTQHEQLYISYNLVNVLSAFHYAFILCNVFS